MRTVAKWIVISSIACTAGKPLSPSRQPAPGRPTLTFASPATSYNGPTEPPPSTTLGDMLVRQVQEAAARSGRPVPVADERLFLAAAALATVVPESGRVSHPFVEFAVQTNGIIEPTPHLLVVWGRLDEPHGGGILEALEPAIDRVIRSEGITHVGVGAVVRGQRGYGAVVLMLLSTRIRTTPIPRAVAATGAVEFELALTPPLRDPRVIVTLPNGNVELVKLETKDAETSIAKIECGGVAGKLHIEIGARTDPNLANFPVWCGMEAPRTFALAPHISDVPTLSVDAERKILQLINEERRAVGRQPLAWDENLAKLAREHSREMQRTNVVASQLPNSMSIKQRVAASRSDVDAAGAVARAYSIAEAHRGLINLPSTRHTLVSADATTIGIGIVYGPWIARGMRELFITEIVAMPKDAWR